MRIATDQLFDVKVATNIRPVKHAYLIRDDDYDGLRRCMLLATTQWGGIKNVIVPFTDSFEIDSEIGNYLKAHPPDICILYGTFTDQDFSALKSCIRSLLPDSSTVILSADGSGGYDYYIHPSHALSARPDKSILSPRDGVHEQLEPLRVLEFNDGQDGYLHLLAMFGQIDPAQKDYYQQEVEIENVPVALESPALWNYQLEDALYSSPLNMTAGNVQTRQHSSIASTLAFNVFITDTLSGIANFWNRRAVRESSLGRPIGRRTLLFPPSLLNLGSFSAFLDFIRSVPATEGMTENVDIFWYCDEDSHSTKLREFLSTIENIEECNDTTFGTQFWFGHPDRVPREADSGRILKYYFGLFSLKGHWYKEGCDSLTIPRRHTMNLGKNEIVVEPPQWFRNRTRGHIAVDVEMSSLGTFPRDESVSNLIVRNSRFTQYGLSALIQLPERPVSLAINLPDPWDALHEYARSRGYEIRVSRPGQYAEAVIQLIGGLSSAGLFASRAVMRLLDKLAQKSSLKVAQRLYSILQKRFPALNARDDAVHDIKELLIDVDVVPEMKRAVRSLSELASDLCIQRTELLSHISELSEIGVVKRGFHLPCSHCGTSNWYPLFLLDERLRCPGCSEEFNFPVTNAIGGDREVEWEYTLNSLMNRAIDQDVLPAILAAHYVTKGEDHFSVPGVELIAAGERDVDKEFDFLSVVDQRLLAGECKSGTEISEKDMNTARIAARFGVHEFYFCTLRRFSDEADAMLDHLQEELRQVSHMTVKRLCCTELIGGDLW